MNQLAIAGTAIALPTRTEASKYDGFVYGLKFNYQWAKESKAYTTQRFYKDQASRDAALNQINN